MSKKKTASSSDMPESFTSRLGIIFAFFAVFALALCARLSYLQISQHDILSAQSEKQYQQTVKIDYGRGRILDRNGTPLATNLETESIYASPQIIFDKEKGWLEAINSLINNVTLEKTYDIIDSRDNVVLLKKI